MAKRDQAIKKFFTPEFRNRLDAVIYFNHLSNKNIRSIVEKFIMELENQLLEKHVDLEVAEEVVDWIAKTGYDPKMGARPIGRVVNEQLRKALANEVLFGKLEKGGKVHARLKNNELKFEFEPEKVEEISP